MNCKFYNDKFDYILIENTYTPNELKNIWNELDDITPEMLGAEHTLSAKNKRGEYKKKNKGIFLDYSRFNNYKILDYQKKFLDNSFVNAPISSIIFKYYPTYNPNKNVFFGLKTLISYYINEDYYELHRDSSFFTLVTFLCKDNSKFSGGQLIFPEYDVVIEPKNNSTIIFPSIVGHEVLPIKLEDNSNNYGRYSITNFMDMNANTNSNFIPKIGDQIDLSQFETFG